MKIDSCDFHKMLVTYSLVSKSGDYSPSWQLQNYYKIQIYFYKEKLKKHKNLNDSMVLWLVSLTKT